MDRLDELKTELNQLRTSLPPSLRVLSDTPKKDSTEASQDLLRAELEQTGSIEVGGFWEEDAGCSRCIIEFKPADKLKVHISDAEDRVGCFVVADLSGAKVGVLHNSLITTRSYNEFVAAVADVFGASEFEIEITEIDTETSVGGRLYFKGKICGDSYRRFRGRRTRGVSRKKKTQ